MEVEFNGISADTLREICNQHKIDVEVIPLAARDAVCARPEVQEFGEGAGMYMADESCCRGYYYCGYYNCGRSTRAPSSYKGGRGRGGKVRTTSGSRSTGDCSGTNCNTGTTDCDSSSDSAGALVIFLLIVVLFLAIIYLAPYIMPLVALGIELFLAILFGLFEILSFGIFRKKFRRILVHFPKPPSDDLMRSIIVDSASFGGLPRRFRPQYESNGFWLLRTGAYLFIPSLVTTLLVLYLQPENDILFRLPIFSFVISIILVWLGNFMINRKTKMIASTPSI
jgi:hypothetical protein